jgi:xanthine/uracil permease
MKNLITALAIMLAIVMAHALPEFIVQNTPAWFHAFMAAGFFIAIFALTAWALNQLIKREMN